MEMLDAGEGWEMAAAGKNQGLNEVCIWDGLRESSSFPTVLCPSPGREVLAITSPLGLLSMQWRAGCGVSGTAASSSPLS